MKRGITKSFLIVMYLLSLCFLVILAVSGSRVVTTVVERISVVQKHCVIIDAGHGGVDGGAISCTGVPESKINLEIALRLEDLLNLLGIRTLMIRRTDVSIYTEGGSIAAKKVSDLKQRVRIINETPNALLISIHQNYFQDSRYGGAQVFYAPNVSSKSFAMSMQNKFVEHLNTGSKRQSKPANNVYLMEKIDCTGVLIECGFLSNPSEEFLLRSDVYQKRICCVIAAATNTFLYSNSVS